VLERSEGVSDLTKHHLQDTQGTGPSYQSTQLATKNTPSVSHKILLQLDSMFVSPNTSPGL
jgi:hypothetical protein